MLLTKPLMSNPSGGRELLCKLNHDVLRDIYGDGLFLCELPVGQKIEVFSIVSALRGYIDGVDADVIVRVVQAIKTRHIRKVFVDGSNLGGLVKAIKLALPEVEICTFFHNVEARFFLGALRQFKSPRAFAVLLVNYLAERRSVYYSEKLICLSIRDSVLLQRLYGRRATHISPMALEDKLPPGNSSDFWEPSEKFALFVGGVFYANRAGIAWFVKNVVPRVQIKVCIVGRGFEDLRSELEVPGKVEVIGAVNSLAEWYKNAHYVIAPIFDGSGMKTKVAEALMYGKKIVGTPEAFSGYEDVAPIAGWQCVAEDDFVAAIKVAQNLTLMSFDPKLRALYDKKYSFSAAKARLEAIMNA